MVAHVTARVVVGGDRPQGVAGVDLDVQRLADAEAAVDVAAEEEQAGGGGGDAGRNHPRIALPTAPAWAAHRRAQVPDHRSFAQTDVPMCPRYSEQLFVSTCPGRVGIIQR